MVQNIVLVYFYQVGVQTVPGDLKHKHFKFDIQQSFTHLKKWKQNHIFQDFWKLTVAHVKIVVCVSIYLNMVDKPQQNSISPFCDSKMSRTFPHFLFHCDISTINLAAFAAILLFKRRIILQVQINNRWKCQCHAADNKAYRAV